MRYDTINKDSDNVKKVYYNKLDIIRLFSCIAVLLYHLGLLEGGYLAVCTFFVLTGYLSIISASKKEKFSIKDYYISRLKKIYLPLLIVVFITIAVITLIPSISYINMKPETTSVLLGYNNYWQLNANLDYFVRHVSSPFIHLWYIAIILQFELVFPIIYKALKSFTKDIKKIFLVILFILLGICSYLFFYESIKNGNLMSAYYGTITRAFSILLGIAVGIIHTYYKPLSIKNNNIKNIVFYIYLLILTVLFIIVNFKSSLFNISMIATTLITLRLIDNSITPSKKLNISELIIKSLSSISYEIYLVQYPVIFLLQDREINGIIKIILIILITIIISYIIHFATNLKNKKNKIIRIIVLIPLLLLSIFGAYKFIRAKDYTEDMKKLEEELQENNDLIKEKQKEYEKNKEQADSNWKEELAKLDYNQNNLKEYVKNLRVVGIGDSIMELCVKELYQTFPNGYFDAATNRFEKHAPAILQDLKDRNMLGDIVVINLGTNGNGLSTYRDSMLDIIGGRKVFWLNATKPDVSVYNPNLIEYASKHDNFYIIDWISYVEGHPEYLIYDGVHPSVRGRPYYANAIYEGILKVFENEYESIKEQKIKEHEELENKKVTFVGNNLLSSIYDTIKEDYVEAEFVSEEKLEYKDIKKLLEDKINNKNLNHNVVLTFDKESHLSNKEYKDLATLLNDYNVYIIDIYNKVKVDTSNVHIININSDDYLSIDKIHLNDDGKLELKKKIDEQLKK